MIEIYDSNWHVTTSGVGIEEDRRKRSGTKSHDFARKSGKSSIRGETGIHSSSTEAENRCYLTRCSARVIEATCFRRYSQREIYKLMHEKHDLPLLLCFYFPIPLFFFFSVPIPFVPHLLSLPFSLSPPTLYPFLIIRNEFPAIQCLGLANVKVHYCGLWKLFCSKVYFSNGPGPFTEKRASRKNVAHFEKSRDKKKLKWIKGEAFFRQIAISMTER